MSLQKNVKSHVFWILKKTKKTYSRTMPMWYPDPPTSQTDRQTDRRHAIAIPRFGLKCIAR